MCGNSPHWAAKEMLPSGVRDFHTWVELLQACVQFGQLGFLREEFCIAPSKLARFRPGRTGLLPTRSPRRPGRAQLRHPVPLVEGSLNITHAHPFLLSVGVSCTCFRISVFNHAVFVFAVYASQILSPRPMLNSLPVTCYVLLDEVYALSMRGLH